jgi:putative N6-adenine-specific DNA methylase
MGSKSGIQGVHVPDFQYQKWNGYFAQLAGGIEDLGVEELSELGARNARTAYKGAYFEADKKALYRINYQSRIASRILAPLLTFQCHSTKYLYRTTKTIPWSKMLSPNDTFAISATVSHSKIRHSKYAALCVKDAIADYFMELSGKRPNVQIGNPNVRINLHIQNNKAIISLDTSGEALHKRGYREQTLEAPIRETLAASIIRLTGWDGQTSVCDPMCGSGTLLCEALMYACRIPSGYLRHRFGFENLADFDRDLWMRVKREEDHKIKPPAPGLLSGSDLSREAVEIARKNCAPLPFGEKIHWEAVSIENIKVAERSLIVCNPPYGVRIGDKKKAAELYRKMGKALKKRCSGSTAFIYIGDPSLTREFGMKPSLKRTMPNGPIEGQLCRFEVFPPDRS